MNLLSNFDRRYIYIGAIAIVIFLIYYPIPFPMKISDDTQGFYDVIEGLPDGTVVALSYDTAARQESTAQPAFVAVLKHLFQKDVKVIILSLNPEPVIMIDKGLKTIDAWNKKTYGVDFVVLGWLPGTEAGVEAFASDIHSRFVKDYYGNYIGDLLLMDNVKDHNDIDILINLSTADPGIKVWSSVYVVHHNTPFIFFCLRSHQVINMPYITSGIAQAALWGTQATAEYELATGFPGRALGNVSILGLLNIYLMAMILLCNINYYMLPREEREMNN